MIGLENDGKINDILIIYQTFKSINILFYVKPGCPVMIMQGQSGLWHVVENQYPV